MKFVFTLATLLGLISCAPKLGMTPLEAKIPELAFFYLDRDNNWAPIYGHGGVFVTPGQPKQFMVHLPNFGVYGNKGKCEIRVKDGNTDVTVGCEDKITAVVDLGQYTSNDPEVIALSVHTEKYRVQFGYLYPLHRTPRIPVELGFICPYGYTKDGIYACSRPASFDFQYSVKVPSGKFTILETKKCDDTELVSITTEVEGPTTLIRNHTSTNPDFCVLGVAMKSDTQKLQSSLYIRYYDPQYIPLAPIQTFPVYTQFPGEIRVTGVRVCAGSGYSLWGAPPEYDFGSAKPGDCENVEENQPVYGWDIETGKFVWYDSRNETQQHFYLYSDVYQDYRKSGLKPEEYYNSKLKTIVRNWSM